LPTILVQRPVLLIGRHPECDVRIDLPKISRRHCCLALVYDHVVIRDLGSRNGVRVNGRVVDEQQLKAGDEIAFGPLIYRLEDASLHPKRVRRSKPTVENSGPGADEESSGPQPLAEEDESNTTEIGLVPLPD
jgi:pSer/pThr/pTyr-binding forkhead associated (FHA) protein